MGDKLDNLCECGDSNCETCFPDNSEQSNYCKPGAFYCPYRNGQVDYPEGLCDGCNLAYTKLEAKLRGL